MTPPHNIDVETLLFNGSQQLDLSGARRDLEVLLAHLLDTTRVWVIAHPEAPVPTMTAEAFDNAVRRLAAGEPLPYLLGHWEFYKRDFIVNPAVLIPRPETELLIDTAIAWGKDRPNLSIIDLCTGSGCIALTLAHELPQATVIASDLSEDALAVAQANLDKHNLGERVCLHAGNLFDGIKEQFDLICANPPYIPTNLLDQLAVSKHEPHIALDGGPGGLDVIREILVTASNHLRPGGMLLCEIGSGQRTMVRMLARRSFFHAQIEFKADLAGINRLLVIRT